MIKGVAYLVWMLCYERHTVLLKLLEGLTLSFSVPPASVIVFLLKGLEAELYSDSHQV